MRYPDDLRHAASGLFPTRDDDVRAARHALEDRALLARTRITAHLEALTDDLASAEDPAAADVAADEALERELRALLARHLARHRPHTAAAMAAAAA